MEQNEVHALTAAYALDALDEIEEREYEAHLRECERCREELASFTETATALAYAVESPAPPAALRDRILATARAERAVVVPLRPRRSLTFALGGVAAAAAALAIVFGLWASSLSSQLDRVEALSDIASDPTARSVPVEGANGRLIVSDSGDAVLALSGLERAPAGKTYELWIAKGDSLERAGEFEGAGERDIVRLAKPVPEGAQVLVTVEPDGGLDAPTGMPFISARA